ncbi:hypothetical protein LB533_15295 [Mesorhizobium sp. BR1-1-13]|uniref:hypothetical protein n=1 Tax=Mesorhizobium sp. BR1-1-13 TaxID=2876656 RepID=UPI001CD0EABF|nr:hypothetical protein [Mesorhizobium sp. BR1-1-13]MBZ9942459.1 hypothetical protein [Mesorhizobium sp. BR1-1-13]
MRTDHNIYSGIHRLHNAPKDVYTKRDYATARIGYDDAPPECKALFADYCRDLKDAYDNARAVWEAKIDSLQATGVSEKNAIAQLLRDRIAGPADHRMLTGVIRKYWLACDEQNRGRPDFWVPPETFAIKWFYDQQNEDFLQLLSALPYWPIGLDRNGDWC